jgi:SNF2 family DNA or RNA helicase
MAHKPKVLDDNLIDQIASGEAERWLILEEHPDFPGRWLVQSLRKGFIFDFEDVVGAYRSVAPATLEAFLERAYDLDYEVAFGEEPTKILKTYEALNDQPSVSIKSHLPGTTNGLLPFQVQGFNFLKDLEGGVALWSTGTGKGVIAAALIKYHIELADFDTALVVVKGHNKINIQRSLFRLAEIDAVLFDGPKKRRQEIAVGLRKAPPGTVVVTNYEKLRIDQQELRPLFEDSRILLIWDEMPTKLKSRQTQLYKSIRSLLYRKADLSERRPKELRQWMLSATPIENDPEDWYNCVRLVAPGIYGSIKDFRDEYVASYSFFGHQPEKWQKLDKLGLKAAHITHEVDKASPDIARQFPEVIEEPFYIDWDSNLRVVYDLLTAKAKEDFDLFDNENVLALISVMQMLCDAPSMVSNSAARREAYETALDDFMQGWTKTPPVKKGSEVARKLQQHLVRPLVDDSHTKLETLRSLITEDHANEKILVFSAFGNALLPILEHHLNSWNVGYVRYDGTAKEKQIAQDYFQNESFCQVFLSSDKGSDSLSLEQASVVIHYDLPWKWSTLVQRQNRVHRVISEHEKVRYYSLLMANSVEERKLEIIQKKKGYHEEIFKGISDQAESARMTASDLRYILTGED